MSKKLEAMYKVIEFAKANGFPGAHACYLDEDVEPMESELSPTEWLDYEAIGPVMLAISLNAYEQKDNAGRVYVRFRDGVGDEPGTVTEVLDYKPEVK